VSNVTINQFSEAWKRQGGFLVILLLVLFVAYFPTFNSIAAIWSRSDTYAHGFIILPISLWLIWRIRYQLLATEPKANFIGIPLLLGLGLVWLLATYIGVLAVEQLAAVMMIPALVFALLGWKTTLTMAFPLFFLLFAVPLGEELTPLLINFTADFTVVMIKLVGIPVFREVNFLELPTGNWSVVAACSGVRYLIASVTLGLLYAYLTYKSYYKRGVFIAASVVVPIFANGLRAFMIVMLGHFSDMKLATGVDHLIYGWLFFGIVIGIMFYIGSFWRDEESESASPSHSLKIGATDSSELFGMATALLAGVMLVLWPIKVQLEQQEFDFGYLPQLSISAPDGWITRPLDDLHWRPAYSGMDRVYSQAFENGDGQVVHLYIGYYAEQRQNAELGSYNNVLVAEKDENWRVANEQANALALTSEGIRTPIAILTSRGSRLVTSYLYYVDGELITNKYATKLVQAKARLLGGNNDGAAIFFSTQYESGSGYSLELLKEFAQSVLPNIKAALGELGPQS